VKHELWDPLLGESNCAVYDGAVDLDVLNVLEQLYLAKNNDEAIFYTEVAVKLSLSPTHHRAHHLGPELPFAAAGPI
jgi:hypothetical protein